MVELAPIVEHFEAFDDGGWGRVLTVELDPMDQLAIEADPRSSSWPFFPSRSRDG